MKVCEKCGAQLEDNAQFCVSCGTKVSAPVAQEEKKSEESKKTSPFAAKAGKNNAATIGVIAVAVVACFALVLLLINLFAGYKKPIKSYLKATEKAMKLGATAKLPAEANTYKVKIKYDIEDSKNISKSKLDDLADIFEDAYDKEYKFAAGKVVEVNVTYKVKDEKDKEETVYYIVVRKGLKWYILDEVSKGSTYDDIDDVAKVYIKYHEK